MAQRINEESQEKAIESFLKLMLSTEIKGITMQDIIQEIGMYYDATRVYVFEVNEGRTFISNTYEWCAKDIPPDIDGLQTLPIQTGEKWEKLLRDYGSCFVSKTVQNDPFNDEMLKIKGIDCFLIAPFTIGGEFYGCLGVDEPKKHTEQTLLLSILASTICKELMLVRKLKKENSYQKELEQLAYSQQEQLQLVATLSQDFLNVYLIHPERKEVKILKLDGYVTEGLSKKGAPVYPYDETCTKYIENRVYKEDIDMMKEVMCLQNLEEQLKTKPNYSGIYRILSEDGIHYYQYKYVRVEGSEDIIAGFQNVDQMIADDIEQRSNLQAALDEAKKANESKTLFLNNMSHDIRTPLNAILGFTELMEREKQDSEAISNYLKKIKTSGNFLLELINNVLDMASIESGNTIIDESFVDLLDEESSILSTLGELIQKKKHHFTITNHIQHPYVLIDEAKHEQILVNLLSNAAKYTPENGFIHMHTEELESDKVGYGRYRTSITDTGIGMSPEFMEHIFDSFARERNTTDSKVIGTGLGMSIVKKLVDLLGGTIEIQSELGKGSCFTLTFDHKIVEQPDEYIAQKRKEVTQVENFKGKRILLAEDNELNAEIAIAILEDMGMIVDHAKDGIACFDMLRKAKEGTYDLILMDIQMPNLNGYDTTRKIRHIDNNIPIIALTANAFEENRKEAMSSGMNGHLSKPIEIPKLIMTLSLFLN